MGVSEVDCSLGGVLRVTTSIPGRSTADRNRISFDEHEGDDDYAQNIQIADLNALNASLAVVKWKKTLGFYREPRTRELFRLHHRRQSLAQRRPSVTADLILSHQFVEGIPERLDELTVYVSIPYATVVHLCPSGCGSEVVTPLGRFDWRLIFDGEVDLPLSVDRQLGSTL